MVARRPASLGGAVDVCRFLVEELGANVDEETPRWKQSPLFYAARSSTPEVIAYLLGRRADVNHLDANMQAPLFYAAAAGNASTLRELLARHADPNQQDRYGQTALFYAAKTEGADGASSQQNCSNDGRSVSSSTSICGAGSHECLQVLLEAVVKTEARERHCWNVRDVHGRTPLFYAARCGGVTSCLLLIAAACGVNDVDHLGQSALFYAASSGQAQRVRLLLKLKALADLQDKARQTPLFWAARRGHIDACRVLVSVGGANPHLCDVTGRSAAHIANDLKCQVDAGSADPEEKAALSREFAELFGPERDNLQDDAPASGDVGSGEASDGEDVVSSTSETMVVHRVSRCAAGVGGGSCSVGDIDRTAPPSAKRQCAAEGRSQIIGKPIELEPPWSVSQTSQGRVAVRGGSDRGCNLNGTVGLDGTSGSCSSNVADQNAAIMAAVAAVGSVTPVESRGGGVVDAATNRVVRLSRGSSPGRSRDRSFGKQGVATRRANGGNIGGGCGKAHRGGSGGRDLASAEVAEASGAVLDPDFPREGSATTEDISLDHAQFADLRFAVVHSAPHVVRQIVADATLPWAALKASTRGTLIQKFVSLSLRRPNLARDSLEVCQLLIGEGGLEPTEGAVAAKRLGLTLFEAARFGNSNVCKLLISQHCSVNSVSSCGRAPLAAAAEAGYASLCQDLLDMGAEVDKVDYAGQTPLFLAAHSCTKCVQELVASLAAPDAEDAAGRTPIFVAARAGADDSVRLLAKARANVNKVDCEGKSPLFFAILESRASTASIILNECGAHDSGRIDVGGVDIVELARSRGFTEIAAQLEFDRSKREALRRELVLAAETGTADEISRLIAQAAPEMGRSPVQASGFASAVGVVHEPSPLHLASARSDAAAEACCKVLLSSLGANPNILDANRQTPLFGAARSGRPECVTMLLSARCDPFLGDEKNELPVFAAARASRPDVLRMLLETRTGLRAVKRKNVSGQTAIFAAADPQTSDMASPASARRNFVDACGPTSFSFARDAVCVLLLLEKRADIGHLDAFGQTAFFVAAAKGREAVINVLVEEARACGRIELLEHRSSKTGQSVLHCAVGEALRLLIEARAALETRDNQGQTPLLVAACRGDMDAMAALAKAKADVNARDVNGQSALLFAAMQAPLESVRLLLSRRADATARNAQSHSALELARRDVNRGDVAAYFSELEEVAMPLCANGHSSNLRIAKAVSVNKKGRIRKAPVAGKPNKILGKGKTRVRQSAKRMRYDRRKPEQATLVATSKSSTVDQHKLPGTCFTSLLEAQGLSIYRDALQEAGYDDIVLLSKLADEEIKEMLEVAGIVKPGHQVKFRLLFDALRRSLV
eukprot:TRINITY_DN14090_c0_g1_i1.p1 TRINITY_DN14090_c0_g1~~TRINITY_DN14090_c0_g1_i1.p1  ORF type:complete len:1361 (-),score=226.65 TRINITY_DN14090_c0_g1_i1:193-4245(-)